MTLSDAAHSVWAKSSGFECGQPTLWSPLTVHLADTAAVVQRCFDEWLTANQWELLVAGLSPDYPPEDRLEASRAFVSFVGGVHDIGKATPAFSSKVPTLDAVMCSSGLSHSVDNGAEVRELPHGLAGHVVLEEWLTRRGWVRSAVSAAASVVGGHHGIPPSRDELQKVRRHRLLGEGLWQDVREELVDWMANRTDLVTYEEILNQARWSQSALVVIEGLLIMADWIASSEAYFPIFSLDSRLPQMLVEQPELHRQRVDKGWAKVGLLPPWEPQPLTISDRDILHARFDVPEGAVPRPIQKKAVEKARTMPTPGLLIIEDVMGSGKTEAGLMAAEILADRSNASGVMMVLPTQAMTDAMFERLIPWLERLQAQSDHPSIATVNLIHGKAALNQTFQELGYQSSEGFRSLELPDHATDVGIDEGDEGISSRGYVTRNPWLYKKKAMLADFVVSTIDQLLMVALRTRHLALRHLGVSRKIVIIDEVHAIDAFMGVYLERALEWLASYGVTVVALSATLPPSLRKKLLDAYSNGLPEELKSEPADLTDEGDTQQFSRRRPQRPKPRPEPQIVLHYPAISYMHGGQVKTVGVEQAFPSRTVHLDFLDSDDLLSWADELVGDGGCLLILRNTVRNAQKTYHQLVETYGDDVRLMHARFAAQHRVENDEWLRTNFGPPGKVKERPKRAIVVATQVAEQSLDIDFDAIITDLAPIDLIFQRIGRVHRHDREVRPQAMTIPSCYVLDVPELSDSQPEQLPSIQWNIYPPALLLRTAATLHKYRAQGLTLPDDMAPLTYWVYDRSDGMPENWESTYRSLKSEYEDAKEGSERAAKNFRLRKSGFQCAGLTGWLDDSPSDAEAHARARVREGDDS
ncbi:MAG: CRISPR-associated helicase Cas3', partial [Actinomycetaceae bacterium]|nr:CRISPR-associated helicase Cas3' [Actinomycetaceae bacterium]